MGPSELNWIGRIMVIFYFLTFLLFAGLTIYGIFAFEGTLKIICIFSICFMLFTHIINLFSLPPLQWRYFMRLTLLSHLLMGILSFIACSVLFGEVSVLLVIFSIIYLVFFIFLFVLF